MDGVDRSGFAEKSAAAQRREDEAKEAFDVMREGAEADSGGKVTVELLQPSAHLTGPCWSAFSKHVKSFAGWSAKRRVASEDEKREHAQTRQAKCYFIDVSYKAAGATKAKAAPAKAPAAKRQKTAPKKKKKADDDDDEEDEEDDE
ncbi:hypothetical protein M885DRAFT_533047 [Pelagophyceae sp. CCMP2097]|nr:hypothetical protein M885DRAFT_533047 [Pelagophyceae sp. CCMP2097]